MIISAVVEDAAIRELVIIVASELELDTTTSPVVENWIFVDIDVKAVVIEDIPELKFVGTVELESETVTTTILGEYVVVLGSIVVPGIVIVVRPALLLDDTIVDMPALEVIIIVELKSDIVMTTTLGEYVVVLGSIVVPDMVIVIKPTLPLDEAIADTAAEPVEDVPNDCTDD